MLDLTVLTCARRAACSSFGLGAGAQPGVGATERVVGARGEDFDLRLAFLELMHHLDKKI